MRLTAFSSMMHLSQPAAWESGLHQDLGSLGLHPGGQVGCAMSSKTQKMTKPTGKELGRKKKRKKEQGVHWDRVL